MSLSVSLNKKVVVSYASNIKYSEYTQKVRIRNRNGKIGWEITKNYAKPGYSESEGEKAEIATVFF